VGLGAVALNREVDRLLHTGRPKDVKATDERLARAFDLDSRSQRSARLWIENRVLGALLVDDEPRGIDSAVHRGRTVGLPEKDLAVGRVASFLVDGDLAGAAALLPKWDRQARDDAYYQLAAGAVLERAGDARALERYDAAARLDPKLIPAEVLLARLLLLEQGVPRARPVIDALRAKVGEAPTVRALEALAWVVAPERPLALPDAAKLSAEDEKALPSPLASVPAMVEAVLAMARGELVQASNALDRAIESAGGPVLAASLGFLAIETGNESLARKAALRALSFAALYPRARTLAARVALLGGRIDEAQRAVEELDPKSPDVAIVHAVVAYETAEPQNLADALQALGAASASPAFAGLVASPGVLLGTRYPAPGELEELASPIVPWGELVALDAALDTGNLAAAEKLTSRRADENSAPSPVLELRAARLARYSRKIDEALAASERAFSGKPTAALVIERVYELVDKEQPEEARELVARYPALLGPMSGWLGVLLDVASNQPAQAAVRLAKLEPPPDDAPTVLRVVVARSLAAAGDKRARPYVLRLAKRLGRHPDVVLALAALK